MSRLVRNLVIVLVLVAGALYFLSTRATEQPQTLIKKPVPNEALTG